MIWVSWRLQRTENLIAAGILALLAALLVPTGLQMGSVYHHDGLAACLNTNSAACHQAIASFSQRFDQLGGLLSWFNLIPGLIGALLAAPLIVELDSGTYRLAWTQSATRARWIAGKLGVALAAALLAALAMTALMTWWRAPLDHLHGRMETSVFDFEGTVVFGYVLFALALALVVGVIWRRTVPALIVGFAGYTTARIFVDSWLRWRYEAPLTATWPVMGGTPGPSNLNHAWVLTIEPSDISGHRLPNTLNLLQSCSQTINSQVSTIDRACLAQHGAGYNHAIYQPASRFWLFQGIETTLFGGTALALILLATWWIHQRVN